MDVVVNCVNDTPQLLRCDSSLKNSWIKLKLTGTKSNRSAIGARVYCATGSHRQMDEVRSGGSYMSQSDLRIHFGLGEAKKVDAVEIRWPSGAVDTLKDLEVNRLYVVEEGGKILKNEILVAAKKKA